MKIIPLKPARMILRYSLMHLALLMAASLTDLAETTISLRALKLPERFVVAGGAMKNHKGLEAMIMEQTYHHHFHLSHSKGAPTTPRPMPTFNACTDQDIILRGEVLRPLPVSLFSTQPSPSGYHPQNRLLFINFRSSCQRTIWLNKATF